MSITSQLERIINAKADLKSGIEDTMGTSIPSNATIDTFKNYLVPAGCYITPPANGVYIKYVGGFYSDYNVIYPGKTAMGISIKTNDHAFTLRPWWVCTGYPAGNVPSGCYYTTSKSSVITDYNGKGNTAAALATGNPGSMYDAVSIGTFADGSTGWLPSCGEMEEIRLNASNVNTALSLIGGTQIGWSSHYYHSSTQVSAYDVWNWRNDQSKWTNLGKGYTSGYFRSVAAL